MIDRRKLHATLCRRKLRYFIEAAWPIVEPAKPFVPNWHIDVVCEVLERVTAGEITRLIVNIPPGCMKSLIISVMWPAWMWISQPHLRFLTAAFIDTNTIRDLMRVRDIVQSEWFQLNFSQVQFRDDQNQKTKLGTSESGWRIATSVGGGGMGEHPDYTIVDDPLNPKMAVSDTQREEANDWFDGTMASRGLSRDVRQVVVMQRLHERDLSGHLLKEKTGWTHLCLPMEYDPKVASAHDRRTVPGELLWPGLFPEASVNQIKENLGSYNAAGQLQQQPVPRGGAIIKRDWFQLYRELPAGVGQYLQSWDMSFKDTKTADFVAGGTWCRKGSNHYLLHLIHERMDITATLKAVRIMSGLYPEADLKLVEDKANGPAVVAMLKNELVGMMPVTPEGSKESRLHAVAPMIEAGNVWVPDPSVIPNTRWVEKYLDELSTFPRAPNDDMVDMTTQALLRYRTNRLGLTPAQIIGDASANETGLPAQF